MKLLLLIITLIIGGILTSWAITGNKSVSAMGGIGWSITFTVICLPILIHHMIRIITHFM